MLQIKNESMYNGLINGAYSVMENKTLLNQINVFPVADGDTGSNLFSTMESIVMNSKDEGTLKKTLESVADSAIIGARGNSGLIFAQYLQGLSEGVDEDDTMTLHDLVNASKRGMQAAYKAIEKPVEGTMLTVMKVFHQSLDHLKSNNISGDDLLNGVQASVHEAVQATQDQMDLLKEAEVVDSGAKGFAYFISGFIDGIKGHFIKYKPVDHDDVPEIEHHHDEEITFRYCTEALIESNQSPEDIKVLLKKYGDSMIVVKGQKKMRIHVHTDTPDKVFETLHPHGKILQQKVDDMVKQYDRVHHRKYNTVIVTDSIADLPKAYLDDEQMHMIHLSLLIDEVEYFDKLTIKNSRLFDLAKTSDHPKSSQPNMRTLYNTLQYLSGYYDHIIVLSVSKALSGTYNAWHQAIEKYPGIKEKVSLIDTKQNSVAQGLLAYKAQSYVKSGMAFNLIIDRIRKDIESSKIWVNIKTIDPMIASGRLSVKAGKIAKLVNLTPIVTLKEGAGAIEKIAFSQKGAFKKLMKGLGEEHKKNEIMTYSITYIDDLASAQLFAKEAEAIIGFPPEYITESSSIIANGAGKGAVAIGMITRRSS